MSHQTKRFYVKPDFIKRNFGKIAVNPVSFALLAVLSLSAISPSYATISCAGYLPSSYFERIETNTPFAGKLIELTDGSQQLEDLNGTVILDGLTDGYILMDKYLLAQKNGKYGVVNAAGKIIVPFEYDDIQTEPDITTSFIVSVQSSEGKSKQGIINRRGEWVYPLANAHIQHAHYDPDYDQDYFLVTDNAASNHKSLTGLLDDKGYWAVMPQYDAISPLNACSGEPLYLQISLKDKTALIDQNNDVIIPFFTSQHIESFNNNVNPLLFLRSSLSEEVADGVATAMSEDIQEDIISAQIIDSNGKRILSSDAPIRKLLYHQLYTFKQAGKFGFIDDQGTIVLKPQFDSYRDDADKVWVEKDGKIVRLETLIKLD